MIVLLEYIGLFTTCVNIILGDHYSVDIILNALSTFTIAEILGVSLQLTHPFLIHVRIQLQCLQHGFPSIRCTWRRIHFTLY